MKKLIAIPTFLVLLLLIVEQGNAFDCEEAKTSLFPCGIFLIGADTEPSTTCCSGVNNLKSSTPTVADRRAACECLKEAASHFPNIREDLAASLPQLCCVDINFTINKNINCKK
ncbi:non-specific lipid-transfer protein [Trifolium pratense]|uniref:Non-specific lipid-transfer protein n=1 Tax=Trifolium pratense TaxID=57577 RepID=A0A2K3MMM2_TRIPR|nr:non-specific lipid-transfer protein [Trifolium pratense]